MEDAEVVARGRALSSPTRLRILRICLHEPHTNKQIAEILQISPAACLHHVRTLTSVRLLEAGEAQSGRRGAREIPYRSTGLSWRTPLGAGGGAMLLETFLQEVEQTDPAELRTTRIGFKLSEDHLAELRDRIQDLLEEFVARGPDADGAPVSLFIAEHPDPQAT